MCIITADEMFHTSLALSNCAILYGLVLTCCVLPCTKLHIAQLFRNSFPLFPNA